MALFIFESKFHIKKESACVKSIRFQNSSLSLGMSNDPLSSLICGIVLANQNSQSSLYTNTPDFGSGFRQSKPSKKNFHFERIVQTKIGDRCIRCYAYYQE